MTYHHPQETRDLHRELIERQREALLKARDALRDCGFPENPTEVMDALAALDAALQGDGE